MIKRVLVVEDSDATRSMIVSALDDPNLRAVRYSSRTRPASPSTSSV